MVMASVPRLLNNHRLVFRKHLFTKSGVIFVRNLNIFVRGKESSFFYLNFFGVDSNFMLNKRNSVTNITYQDAVSTLREKVDLSHYPKVRLEKVISFFVNDGFEVDEGINLISQCPDILKKTEKEMEEVISALRSCGFRDEETKEILKTSPTLLCCNVNNILSRYKTLKQMFSRQHIVQILLRCPNIMFRKWSYIQKNIEYLKNEMKISEKQIAYSSALECPIDVIKARHVFLSRAGLYITPEPKSNLKSNNPKLSSIVDTDDVYFAESVANLTAEEYFVFLEMFHIENSDRESDDEFESEESE